MGRVYLARSPGGRMVAVKVIRAQLAEDAGFRARFAREVVSARKVGGLFTAQVVDANLDDPIPWLVTAYVQGVPLSEAVEQHGPLTERSVLALAAGLAEGLIAIHAAGVIHRDLKPSNVLLAPDGPRIIDFGISSAAEATSLTGTGLMIGSPGFMSPEQAEGQTVGPSSDIFSLAAVLTFASRGEGPFGSGETAALLYRVVHTKPNCDSVPDKIKPLIRKSLGRDPKRRPTAHQFLSELTAAYPSAADLTDWLPPWLVNASAQRDYVLGVIQHPPTAAAGGVGAGPGPAMSPPPVPGMGSYPSPPPRTEISRTPTPAPIAAQGPPAPQGYPGAAAGSGSSWGTGASAGTGSPAGAGSSGDAGSSGSQGNTWWAAAAAAAAASAASQDSMTPASATPPSGTPGWPPASGTPASGIPQTPATPSAPPLPWDSPQAPSQGYGGSQTPAPGYGGAQATPASPYGGGQTPPPSYGSPQAPSAGYGAQQAPGPGYGAPQAPSPGYGGAGYGAAQAPGSGYGGPQTSPPLYGAQQTPPPIYGSPQTPTPGYGSSTPVYGGSAGGQGWQPYAGSSGRRRGPRWLLVAGISAVVAAIIAAVIVSTQGGHHAAVVHPTVGPSASATTARPTASATPTTGNLLLDQLQVGDCLKGADLDLNTSNPWPKLSLAVPCSQGHTAEVFYANNNFFPKNGSYPGDKAISKAGTTACDNAFQAYVGIAYSKSQYTWTNIIPDASTWPNPNGDRALHCVAYYSTSAHPAGATLTGSIKGTDQ
jgi:eukaryotic-like serine/threonine-protein kinase